jgi:mycofactocin system transcriptional regulator
VPEIKAGHVRRGRPPATSARDLELVALRLFADQGYDATTVEQIAAEAGVSRRTFFRHFDTKADVLWHDFDGEVRALQAAFAAVEAELTVMAAIREVVVSVNHYRAADVPELRNRIHLIATIPALQASSAPHYDAWERAVSDYAAQRLRLDPTDLVPLAIGRCTLAACRAAFDEWVTRADRDLTVYLDEALRALGSGFADSPTNPLIGGL